MVAASTRPVVMRFRALRCRFALLIGCAFYGLGYSKASIYPTWAERGVIVVTFSKVNFKNVTDAWEMRGGA